MARYRVLLLLFLVVSLFFINTKVDEFRRDETSNTVERTPKHEADIPQDSTESDKNANENSDEKSLEEILQKVASGSSDVIVAKEVRAITGAINGDFLGEGYIPRTFGNMTLERAQELIYKKISTEDYECKNIVQYGVDEGEYFICMDVGLTPGECIVYSYGILRDWSFDKETNKELKCEVHSYDPGIGLTDHEKRKGLFFHNLGIWDKAWTNNKGWIHNTMNYMMEQNNHLEKAVDVVKLHIEGAEWVALDNIIKNGSYERIKQITVVIHTPRFKLRREEMSLVDYAEVFDILDRLEKVGFKKWHYNNMSNNCCVWFAVLVPRSNRVICCAKLYYVNERYL